MASPRVPSVLGVGAALVAMLFSWTPSLWGDEAATVVSVDRSWGELFHMLGTIDAVHGLYYVLMKCWFAVVGYTPFTLRLPSALAIGAAASLVVVLGRRLGGARLGVLAGIAFVLLPRVAWAGLDGRPYAIIALVAVATTLAFHAAWAGGGRAVWVAYGVLATVGVALNVYLVLVVLAHAVTVVCGAVRRGRAVRPRIVAWCSTAGAVAVATAPLVLVVRSQAGQVSWIPALGPTTLRHITIDAWFRSTWPFSTLAVVTLVVVPVGWGLIALGVRAGRRFRPLRGDDLSVLQVALPLALVPSVALLAATAVGVHLYSPQYVTMSTPFVAILMALGIGALRRRRFRVAAIVTLVATAVPALIAVRLPHANQDLYWSEASEAVRAARGSHPTTADGVVFGTLADAPWVDSRLIATAYPAAFDGMRDLATVGDARSAGEMWDRNGDVAMTVPQRVGGLDRVWYLGDRDADPLYADVSDALSAEGFAEVRVQSVGQVLIVEYGR